MGHADLAGHATLSLYQVLDPKGSFVKERDTAMGAGQFWKVNDPLDAKDFGAATARLGAVGREDGRSVRRRCSDLGGREQGLFRP